MNETPLVTSCAATCPRCKRPAVGWPWHRADVCSPTNWADCIRDPRPEWLDAETTDDEPAS